MLEEERKRPVVKATSGHRWRFGKVPQVEF